MTPSAEAGLFASVLITVGITLVIAIGIYVWYAVALSKLFPRIGGEAWKGWVPVLNEAEILARGGVPAWSVVYYFIPLVNIYGVYLKVIATNRINQQFGRGAGMTVLAILLPPLWATILAGGAPPYPEGDRLAALQPGPRRTPQPAFGPEGDAAEYPLPSFAPQKPASAHANAAPTGGFVPPARPSTPGAPETLAPLATPQSTPQSSPQSTMPPEWAAFAPAPSAPAAAPPAPAAAPQPFVPAPPSPAAPTQPPAPAPAAAQPSAPSPAPAAAQPPAAALPPAFAPLPPAFAPTPSASPAPAPASENVPFDAVENMDTVRAVPPTFRQPAPPAAEPAAAPAPQMPLTEPVATPPAPAAAQAPAAAPAPFVPTPASPLGGLPDEVAETVISPRRVVIEDDLEETVIVARKRGIRRSLVLDDGRTFALSGASVVIGRNPTGEAGEQRLAISDGTRTLSKTHARLVVTDDEWRLTDLHATNGVVVVADDGAEVLLDPGESVIGTGRFILGEVGMHVIAERDS
ncbi:DUF5684 domain-containing protein [Microbacterium sp. NPDC087665]|uniref:DUF5684 domain-containing protein n=1 Tax=Microbacterium sp. NPDC087665 TaxID=3364194 RepID=UPI003820F3B3